MSLPIPYFPCKNAFVLPKISIFDILFSLFQNTFQLESRRLYVDDGLDAQGFKLTRNLTKKEKKAKKNQKDKQIKANGDSKEIETESSEVCIN